MAVHFYTGPESFRWVRFPDFTKGHIKLKWFKFVKLEKLPPLTPPSHPSPIQHRQPKKIFLVLIAVRG
jgi:hypothetical protein